MSDLRWTMRRGEEGLWVGLEKYIERVIREWNRKERENNQSYVEKEKVMGNELGVVGYEY